MHLFSCLNSVYANDNLSSKPRYPIEALSPDQWRMGLCITSTESTQQKLEKSGQNYDFIFGDIYIISVQLYAGVLVQ